MAVLRAISAGVSLENLGVAVHGQDAEQVPAWCAQHTAFQPLGYLRGAEGQQSHRFGPDVIGLDVDMESRRVIDCLDGGDEPGYRPVQDSELRLAEDLPG